MMHIINIFLEFYDLIKFDGLWIDMNEPANFVAGDLNKGCAADNKLNYPDYTPHVSFISFNKIDGGLPHNGYSLTNF